MKTNEDLKVEGIILLFLCKTATKKTLWLVNNGVVLLCEVDDSYRKTFFTACANKKAAKELHRQCVEWLNY